uniref:hypothetical protein n=1 Tax=uncultured Lactobacillus sp. TaxID=153152 RepID=UPI0026316260
MVDKEEKEKLTEALKEYIGEDVGDVDYCYGEDLQESGRRITIITKPHKPTFKEKRKELVDQLNKELKEIDDNYSVVKGIASPDVTYIHYDARPYCELYLNGNINFHGVYDSVKQMTKAMEAISGFSW